MDRFERFVANVGGPIEDRELARRTFHAQLSAACTAHPDLAIDLDKFVLHVAGKLPPDRPASRSLGALHIADLLLAYACASADGAALTTFESSGRSAIRSALAQLSLDDTSREDFESQVYAELVTGDRPLLLRYGGSGSLSGWLRVVTARRALKLLKRRKRELSAGDGWFDALFETEPDPELDNIKELYRREFREAFRAALGRLEVRDRNLLKQTYIDGLTVSQLGKVYRVHRATAARWVASAREALSADVKRALVEQLGIETAEYDSLVNLVESRLEITLGGLADDA